MLLDILADMGLMSIQDGVLELLLGSLQRMPVTQVQFGLIPVSRLV